jgi:hypothetical protein
LLEQPGSNDRAKDAQWKNFYKYLRILRYMSIYQDIGRQIVPSAEPSGQILPGKFRGEVEYLAEPRRKKRNAGRPLDRPALIASLGLVADHLNSERID